MRLAHQSKTKMPYVKTLVITIFVTPCMNNHAF
jgi:hypothetical protein